MPRPKTDLTAYRKSKERKSFGTLAKQCDAEWEDKGIAEIRSIAEKAKCFEVTGLVRSLDRETSFGFAKGFLPLFYEDGDIMAQFRETFDNPEYFDEVIGKEALVEIEFRETDYGELPYIVSFAKLTE